MTPSQLPAGPVTGLAFLPTGELLAVTPAGLFRGHLGAWQWLAAGVGAGAVAIHPHARLVAWATTHPNNGLGYEVTRLPGGESVRQLFTAWSAFETASAATLRFTPDGDELHTKNHSGMIRWQVGTWRMLDNFPPGDYLDIVSAAGHRVTGIVFYFADHWCLHAPNGTLLRRERVRRRGITTALFSADSRTLYLAIKSRIRRFDANTGAELTPRNWGRSRVTALAVSDDGLTAALGTRLGEIIVWDED